MTPMDFIDEFRRTLDDRANDVDGQKGDLLWSDEEIVGYVNSAIDEACERALLIEDHLTAACCNIDLEAGRAEYDLHPSVIKVKRVAWGSRILHETSTEALDEECFGWETRNGRPERYIQAGSNTIRLYRIPTADDIATQPSLALTVYRKLLEPISIDAGDTELVDIKPIYQLRLMPWAYHRAYMKRDADTFSPVRAGQFEAEFTASFGERPDANVQRKRRDKRPPIVRMRW